MKKLIKDPKFIKLLVMVGVIALVMILSLVYEIDWEEIIRGIGR